MRSCLDMDPEEGYREAGKLLKQRYGQSYKIATAYVDKVTKGPAIKSEDRIGLQNFATLLTSCRNTLKSTGYSSKIENPDSLRGVINRLPYDLRKKWRNTADQISEDQDREIKFEDVEFVEKQARAPSYPVFGDIWARSWDHEREKNSYSKLKGKSFAIKGDDADQERSNENKEDPAGERNGNPKNCPKCTRDHYLPDCP